jgi:hypothetical protein
VFRKEAEERVFLKYFGQAPDAYQLARFFPMRQFFHMVYAMAFLFLGSSAKKVDVSERVHEFTEFHRRIWAGEVNLADSQMRTAYGRIHWKRR